MANQKKSGSGTMLGFEEKLWQAADKQRKHMDAAVYKHVVPDFSEVHFRLIR